MDNKKHSSFLIIADISGYTKFMLNNQQSIVHSQTIITSLINSLIKEIDIPLKINKLEGDAVFIYTEDDEEKTLKKIREKLFIFYQVFNEKLNEIKNKNICPCSACSNIGSLKLKIIVHYGEILLYKINNSIELSGTDVIIIHRLLKNSVKSDEYLLITENAFNKIDLSSDITFEKRKEKIKDMSSINIYVHYINRLSKSNKKTGILSRILFALIFHFQILLNKFKRKRHFHYLNEKDHNISSSKSMD